MRNNIIYLMIAVSLIEYACGKTKQDQVTSLPKRERIEAVKIPKPKSISECSDDREKSPVAEFCKKFWAKQDSLNRIKLPYFADSLVARLMMDSLVPQENREFLIDLNDYLVSRNQDTVGAALLSKPLFPIFNLKESGLAILTFQHHVANSAGVWKELSNEGNFLKRNPQFRSGQISSESPFLDSLVGDHRSLYTYSDHSTNVASIISFAFFEGECFEYFYYPISIENLSENENLLFGSTYKLKLDFASNSKLDSLLKNQYAEGCYDCSFKYEPAITFAALVGVDNLFFTYTDTFSPENQYDYPARSLIMMIGDSTPVIIWSEDVDLFGCSCL